MKEILRFICEMGHLQRVRHEGWALIGVENPKSVAEHSLRAAQIGYLLAHNAGFASPSLVCSMLVFHDMAETRIGDLHKVAARYLSVDEPGVVREQIEGLNSALQKELFFLWNETDEHVSQAGQLAKDSDLLEQAVTAKELIELGYVKAHDWLVNLEKRLQTNEAKSWMKYIRDYDLPTWWEGLKKRG